MSFVATGIAASVAASIGAGTSALAVGAVAAGLSAVAGSAVSSVVAAATGGDVGKSALIGAGTGLLAGAGGAVAGSAAGAAAAAAGGASSVGGQVAGTAAGALAGSAVGAGGNAALNAIQGKDAGEGAALGAITGGIGGGSVGYGAVAKEAANTANAAQSIKDTGLLSPAVNDVMAQSGTPAGLLNTPTQNVGAQAAQTAQIAEAAKPAESIFTADNASKLVGIAKQGMDDAEKAKEQAQQQLQPSPVEHILAPNRPNGLLQQPMQPFQSSLNQSSQDLQRKIQEMMARRR